MWYKYVQPIQIQKIVNYIQDWEGKFAKHGANTYILKA